MKNTKNLIKGLVIFTLIICFSMILKGIVNATNNKTPVEEHGKLSVKESTVFDKNGNKFQLRGISTHGVAWFPQYINKEAFEYMRDEWKINTIRLAMYSSPDCGYNEQTKNKVKEGIEYAKNAGLYVIVDWHILNDGNPNIYKNEAIEFFKEIANTYKGNPNIIYEICNEPNGDVQWERDIKPYAEEVIREIRNIDQDSIIIVGTPTWSQDVDIVAQSPITGYNNIMYSLHFYAATHKENIRNKLSIALDSGLPIFVTEFGICDASGNGNIDIEEANKWIEKLNENNISYVCWNLSNKNESSALLNAGTDKITGWTNDELSEEGKWLVETLGKYKEEQKEETIANIFENSTISDETTIKRTTTNDILENKIEPKLTKQFLIDNADIVIKWVIFIIFCLIIIISSIVKLIKKK